MLVIDTLGKCCISVKRKDFIDNLNQAVMFPFLGYDGQCQWLICEEGLTSRCKTLIQMCEVTKYCLGSNVTKLNDFPNSIWDWWPPAHTQQSFVNGRKMMFQCSLPCKKYF